VSHIKKYFSQIILICVLVAGGSFFAGYQVGKGKTPNPPIRMGQGNMDTTSPNRGAQNRPTGNQGMQPVAGEIISLDSNILTVKSQDGSSKIIILSDSTKINLSMAGSRSDLQTGVEVTVMGTANSDGSVTAKTVDVGLDFADLNYGPGDKFSIPTK
jgi:hypothetical protein